LLPHLTRLVPMADRFLQSRLANEKAEQEALTTMSTALRTDLGHLTAANATLSNQLQEQSFQIAQLTDEVNRTRITVDSAQLHADNLQTQLATLARSFKIAAIAIVTLLLGLVALVAELLHLQKL
jgi:chromosome segregation ATPase